MSRIFRVHLTERPMARLFYVCLLLMAPLFLTAQIVNTERMRIDQQKEGWTGTVAANFSAIQNVRQSRQLGFTAGVEYLRKKHRMLVLTNYKLNRIDGTDGANQGFGHMRYNYDVTQKWILEGFGQLQFNTVQLMRVRALTGGGLRLRIADTDSFHCYLGSLYMFEYEELNDGFGTFHRDHRQSSYANIGLDISANATLDHITYYQPMWGMIADFRISSETRLSFIITKKVRFDSTFSFVYDSRPPIDLPRSYYTFTNGLRVEL